MVHGYPMVKKFLDTFICFDVMYIRDGRTVRWTDDGRTRHDGMAALA